MIKIYSYWNVNVIDTDCNNLNVSIKIYSYWNVNFIENPADEMDKKIKIYSYWNVNLNNTCLSSWLANRLKSTHTEM